MWQLGPGVILELDVELAWSEYLHPDVSDYNQTLQTNFHLKSGQCQGEMGSGFQLGKLPDSFKSLEKR